MPKFHVAQNNFNGGVLGELLQDRYDLPNFENSIKKGVNGFPLIEGPFVKRAGSIYIDDVLNNNPARLISFRFSKDVKYLLEFTAGKIRFFKNRTKLDYTLDTNLTYEQIEGIYTSQLSDLLLMTSSPLYPQQLKRTSDTNWSLSNIVFYDGPYLDTNTTDTQLFCSAATGTVNLNSSASLFTSDDVGRHWRLRSGDGWAWGICTQYNSETQIVIQVKEGNMPVSPYQTKLWKKGIFSNSDGNYPSVCCLHAKRLWLGGFKDNPALVVASKSSDFFNYAPTDISTGAIGANNSVSINLSSNGVSDIQFIEGSDKGLDIGTSGGIWIIDTSAGYVDQSAFAALKNNQGAANVKPVVTGPSIIYVQRSNRKIMDIQYSFTEDGYKAPELSLFNKDYMKNGIKYIEYQQDPISALWCLDTEGKMYSLSYDSSQSVYAWGSHNFGDKIESFTIIPSTDGSSEDIWMVVNRSINGSNVRYIEYMPSVEEMKYENRNKIVYCDSAKYQYFSTAVNEINGLSKLEGRECVVLGDGNHLGVYTVNNGKIKLADGVYINHAVVGIMCIFEVSTISRNFGFQNGATLHKIKSISGVKIGLYKSMGGEYKSYESGNWYTIPYLNSTINMDTNVPLYTGIKNVDVRSQNDYDGTIFIRQRQGLPFGITSITMYMENSDDV